MLFLEAAEPWPLGRYFLRVARDGRRSVCEIAFEPVVGAVTDTCNRDEGDFGVAHRYDEETRAIDELEFVGAVSRVDVEILVAEELPPLVDVHHDVVVQKCSYGCELAAPLRVEVQLRSAAQPPSVDAGASDAGAADTLLDAGSASSRSVASTNERPRG